MFVPLVKLQVQATTIDFHHTHHRVSQPEPLISVLGFAKMVFRTLHELGHNDKSVQLIDSELF
jgi:hypothetical protein